MNVFFENKNFKWININNSSFDELNETATVFNFVSLVNNEHFKTRRLPKFIAAEGVNYLSLRFFHKEGKSFNNTRNEFSVKLNIFYSDNFIVTYYQKKHKHLQEYIENFERNDKTTSKDLIYYLITSSLASFENIALDMDNEIVKYEEIIFTKDGVNFDLKQLYNLKKEANACKKILNFMDQALANMIGINDKSVRLKRVKETNLTILNLHTQLVDDTQNLLNIYISLNSQKANEIMKTLLFFQFTFYHLLL